MKLIIIGNSIVNGFPLRRSQCFASLLRTEYGYEVINKGINGDTTGGVLLRFEKDALASRSDNILLMTGTNDFIMGGSVDTAIHHVHEMAELAGEGRLIALTPLLTHPALAGRMWMRADYGEVNRKLQEFAERLERMNGIGILDTQAAYKRFAETVSMREAYVDGIHPGAEGHLFLAEFLAQEIKKK